METVEDVDSDDTYDPVDGDSDASEFSLVLTVSKHCNFTAYRPEYKCTK